MYDIAFRLVIAAAILAVLVLPAILIAVLVRSARSKVRAPSAVLLAILLGSGYLLSPWPRFGLGLLYFSAPPIQPLLVRLDLALSRHSREEVVQLMAADALHRSDRPNAGMTEFDMPPSARGLSVWGTVDLVDRGCRDQVFFMTLTGFSPDPYAGFEYVPAGCSPEPDPLGSGHGIVEDLGDSWFWIVAS